MRLRRLQIILFVIILNSLTSICELLSSSPLSGRIPNGRTRISKPLEFGTEISIAAVGDIMLGSWVIPVLEQYGASYPFQKTSQYFKVADVAIGNLEAPFADTGEVFEKKFNFKVPPKYAYGVREGGIEVVTLANNHIMDYGEPGLATTIQTLDRLGIKHSGAGLNMFEAHQPVVVEVRGKKVAFFGYSMTFPSEFYATYDSSGTAYPDSEFMQCALTYWEDLVDFSVVSFHWSAEKLESPKDYQIHFAHLAIDSGADLVLGHHPHVLQGIEIYKNRLIAYSLGNFAFGSYSNYAVDSIILKIYLEDGGLYSAQCIPINVDNREVEFQPQVVDGKRKEKIISKLQELSLPLNNRQNIISDSGLIFGDWASFYDGWLLDVAVRSFWNIAFSIDLFENNKFAAQSLAENLLDSTH